jgi:hypothetical protein
MHITTGSHFGYTSGHFSMDKVRCHGNETHLADCPHIGAEGELCYGGEAAGVVCDIRDGATIETERNMTRDCFVEDVIYGGIKINGSKLNTSIACQDKCKVEPNCTHFTLWPVEMAQAQALQDCQDICLRGGSGTHEGNVIVRNKPVCDDNWGTTQANVVCKQLGFPGASYATTKSRFGRVSSVFAMDDVVCRGQEAKITDCRHKPLGTDNCGSDEAAGVRCLERQIEQAVEDEGDMVCDLFSGREQGRNKTIMGGAITGPKSCSGPTIVDVPCNGSVCLQGAEAVNGSGNVFYHGKPVCDDSWDILAAAVVCRQLNFAGVIRATNKSHFGPVPRVFSKDDVVCLGREPELGNCSSSDVENCDGTEGAGVVCDTRRPQEIVRESQRRKTDCFSDKWYSSMEGFTISFNGSFLRAMGGFADSALMCQVICANTPGCTVFSFQNIGPPNRCRNYRVSPRWLPGRNKIKILGLEAVGPAECHDQPPALESYLSEDCSAPGVACMAGGRGPWEGVPHIGGRPVCRESWGQVSARVFCRQLGYRTSLGYMNDQPSPVRGPFAMTQVQCTGSEASLGECDHEANVTSCLQWEGAWARCEQFDDYRSSTRPTPTSSPCSTICLQGGSGDHEGNLFVRSLPVCDDSWGMEEAEVVCRQLGFPGAVNSTMGNQFGPVYTSRFSMDNVECTGMEDDIQSCSHESSDDCGDQEGAGVICLPPTPAPPPSTHPAPAPCTLTVHSGRWANMAHDDQFHMKNILYDDCDSFSWPGPDGYPEPDPNPEMHSKPEPDPEQP